MANDMDNERNCRLLLSLIEQGSKFDSDNDAMAAMIEGVETMPPADRALFIRHGIMRLSDMALELIAKRGKV